MPFGKKTVQGGVKIRPLALATIGRKPQTANRPAPVLASTRRALLSILALLIILLRKPKRDAGLQLTLYVSAGHSHFSGAMKLLPATVGKAGITVIQAATLPLLSTHILTAYSSTPCALSMSGNWPTPVFQRRLPECAWADTEKKQGLPAW